MKKKLIKKWHGGVNFSSPEDKTSSHMGVLSFEGVPVAYTYRSEITDSRYIITTVSGNILLRLNRKAIVLSDSNFASLLTRVANGTEFAGMFGTPPRHLNVPLIEELADIPKDKFQRDLTKILHGKMYKRRFLLITRSRMDDFFISMRLLRRSEIGGVAWWFYTTDSADEITFATLAGSECYLIDRRVLTKRAREKYQVSSE